MTLNADSKEQLTNSSLYVQSGYPACKDTMYQDLNYGGGRYQEVKLSI